MVSCGNHSYASTTGEAPVGVEAEALGAFPMIHPLVRVGEIVGDLGDILLVIEDGTGEICRDEIEQADISCRAQAVGGRGRRRLGLTGAVITRPRLDVLNTLILPSYSTSISTSTLTAKMDNGELCSSMTDST